MPKINEITMIDAACMAVASGNEVFITINYCLYRAVHSNKHNGRHKIVAKITGHGIFEILDNSYKWPVEPQKVREIHMNRRLRPW